MNERLLIGAPKESKGLGGDHLCSKPEYSYVKHSTNTTHKLQPLDRVFMKPFKDTYYEVCGLWMRKNPAARITEYEIASLVGDVVRVSRADIAIKGFQCTGIHPLNANVFTELDYLPTMMTDIAMDSNVDQKLRAQQLGL
ncbi:hypothetical protein ANN_27457 [Periplaneta americana]|uniref:Uncharacterized protein n=1 Tax=Periplaneta americana TaxID=6978 RepID=A0ABQ8RVT3_PERAM|nr:hypothetical protein ANN_27457 [Periplaneta americana]